MKNKNQKPNIKIKKKTQWSWSLNLAEKKLIRFYKKEAAVVKKLRHPYGKSYFWIKLWEKLFEIPYAGLKIILRLSWKLSYTSVIFSIVAVILFGTIPSILSAPHFVEVKTKEDWGRGTLKNVNNDGAKDAIQLEPEGSWTEKIATPTPDTIGYGSSSVMVGNYLYLTRGWTTKSFWRFDTINNEWETLADLPQPAYYGADLAYLESSGEIYATFGGYSKKFYKYNIATEEWIALYDLPNPPYSGSAIESDGVDIYFIQGNASSYFYRYDVDAESEPWSLLSGTLATVTTGGNLVYGQDDYMYLVRGNGVLFDRYKIRGAGAGNWTNMANINVSAVNYTITGETKGVYWTDGTIKYLYFLRSGGTSNVLRYQITCNDGTEGVCAGQKNTWSLVTEGGYGTPGLALSNYASMAYNETDGYIYTIQGNNTQNMWKLDPDGPADQKWAGPKNIQNTAGALYVANTGADLIYNGNFGSNKYIYALNPVGATVFLNKYDPGLNIWTNTGLANLTSSVTTDVTGTFDKDTGYLYYPMAVSRNIGRYTEGGAWSTITLPAAVTSTGNGTSLAYVGGGTPAVYVLQGNNTSGFFSCNTLLTACSSAGSLVIGTMTYNAGVGAKLVSAGTYESGTDLYATVGNGETAFLKYSSGAWTRMTDTPFTQYFGTSLTTYNGKIYALAGYYKDETWEYDISDNSWRKLPRNQKFSYGRGPYNGANIEYDGGTSLYATTGLGLSDMWKYSISDTNYPTEGTYESETFTLDYVDSEMTFTVEDDVPANTEIVYQVKTSDDAIDWSEYDTVTIAGGTGILTPDFHKYLKVKIILRSTDAGKISTPTVYNYSVTYNRKSTPPNNPTTINGSSQKTGGIAISSGLSYPYMHPHFLWSGATHNGSGIAGYYVCFDTAENCDDPETDGSYQSSNIYTVNTALKTGTYHLKIKTIDNNENEAATIWNAFTYVYNGVSVAAEEESLHETRSTEAEFNDAGAILSDVDAYDNGGVGSLRLNSVNGFWNQNRLSVALGAINVGGELALGGCKNGALNELNGNHCIYTFAGNNLTTFYRYEIETDTWTTRAIAPMNTNAGSTLTEGPNNTLYATRGAGNGVPANQKAFWSYNIVADSWSVLSNTSNNFTAGSTMTYDGNRYIYANPGTEDAIFRYDTSTGGWDPLTDINFGNPNSSATDQFTGEGSDAVYVDNDTGSDYLYALQGSAFPYFTRYQVQCNNGSSGSCAGEKYTSLPMAQAPIGFFNSGSLTYDSYTNAIYAIAGNPATSSNARQYFLKYDIDTNSWSDLPDAPGDIVGTGGSIVNYDGHIYFTRGGGATNFYRFNIAENSWELPKNGFFGPHIPTGNVTGVNSYLGYGNGTYVSSGDGENIYLTRGTYSDSFGKYNVATGTFTEMAKLPVGATTGASLVYDDNEEMIYYVPGALSTVRSSADDYFFKYDIADNSWSEVNTVVHPSATVGAGSSMAYDGSRYIYLTQGGNGTNWWRYDTCRGGGVCTPNWSANLNNPASTGWAQEAGARIIFKDDVMYSIRGGGNATNGRYFFSCDVSNPASFPKNCWTRAAGTDLPAGVVASTGGSLIDGNDGNLYVVVGNSTNTYYRYNIATPGWTQVANMPGQPTTGGSGAYQSNRAWSTTGAGTNSYNDGLYSYVIGSATNGVGFEKTGSYTSETMDLFSVYDWANLTATYILPDTSTTFLTFETQTSDGLNTEGESGDPEESWVWSDWALAYNDHTVGNNHSLSINSDAARYIKIRINFTSSDQIFSPRVDEITVNYYQDLVAPTNPDGVTAYGAVSGEDRDIITNPLGDSWFKYTAPHFEWAAEETEHGAHDNAGGSGVAGYYVYFGESIIGEPIAFQEGITFTAPVLNIVNDSGKTYYLRIQAVDNAGLPASEILNAFTYKFDRTLPTNPTGLDVNPKSYSSVDSFVFTWNDNAADGHSGIDKIEWCTDCDPDQHIADIVWNELDEGIVTVSVPPYQPNTNIFFIRVRDKAGNVSSHMYAYYYYSGGPASPPQNLNVTPDNRDNAVNNFTFTWDLPSSYAGDLSKIKYYYSINVWPTAYNTIETTATAAGPGPFATQFDDNIFYVVALSEGGVKTNPNDIDWLHPAQKIFYAQTTAPGPPVNLQSFDTSDRESAEYSVALKWSQPSSYDAGNFAGYAIYRAEDDVPLDEYEEIATTTGSAYVDTNLESKLYYYYVESKDKTNNHSIPTSVVSLTPTGRFTSPPTILSQPKITIKAYEATVTWSTNRVCSSFTEAAKSLTTIGKSEQKTDGQVDSVTDHVVVMTGLEAGTKYYYRAKFIDPDGNIGTSEITSFSTLPPPTISEVTITDIKLDTAFVSWTTNASATCDLKYGSSLIEETSGGASHIQKITGLSPVTSYSVQISCLDGDGNSFSSDEYSFTTPQQPLASEVTVQNKDNVDLPTVTVAYKTNVPTTTLIYFKASDESSPHTFLLPEKVTEHQAEITDLDPAKEYTLSISGVDDNGIAVETIEQKITTRSDSRPPQITTNRSIGRVVGRGNTSQANIYVKVETDEVTKIKIKYAMGVTVNLEQVTPENSLNTYHLITIPANPSQVYSYQIEAADAADNITKSELVTVVVENTKANATEIIAGTFSNRFGWISNLWKQ